jgi:hypothetical protein
MIDVDLKKIKKYITKNNKKKQQKSIKNVFHTFSKLNAS